MRSGPSAKKKPFAGGAGTYEGRVGEGKPSLAWIIGFHHGLLNPTCGEISQNFRSTKFAPRLHPKDRDESNLLPDEVATC